MASDAVIQARNAIEQDREDVAFTLLQHRLTEERDDVDALDMLGFLFAKSEAFTTAWLYFRRVHELRPTRADVMSNIGMTLEGLGRYEEARGWFRKAHKADPKHANYPCNLGLTFLSEGEHELAREWGGVALKLDPKHRAAQTCIGFADLAMGNWADGWAGYESAIGTRFRAVQEYGKRYYDGQTDGDVIVYGEQGIGDEILFGSCIPDLVRHVAPHRVIIDCDAPLAKLFARSFPEAIVYGTRKSEEKALLARHQDAKYQTPVGSLPKHFRPTPAACPGTPFLAVDPELALMYGTLTRHIAQGRRRIGLTWSGGLPQTGAARRSPGLAAFAPIIQANPDVAWFSLEYKPESAKQIAELGLPIRHVHMAVGKGAQYDQTAAFIASLDGVLGVDTAAHHCAGALGVPALTLLHHRPTWLHGKHQGDRLAWYDSVKLYRPLDGESWTSLVERLLTKDAAKLSSLLKGSE